MRRPLAFIGMARTANERLRDQAPESGGFRRSGGVRGGVNGRSGYWTPDGAAGARRQGACATTTTRRSRWRRRPTIPVNPFDLDGPRRPLRCRIEDWDVGSHDVVQPMRGKSRVGLVLLEAEESTTERQRGQPGESGIHRTDPRSSRRDSSMHAGIVRRVPQASALGAFRSASRPWQAARCARRSSSALPPFSAFIASC